MDVVLIHGMGRTPLSMMRLRRRLRQAGHRPFLFGYSPTFENLERVTARLVRLVERRVGAGHYALLGHSLGTVIIRSALGALRDRPPSACFFLAPPMVACRAARFFARFWPYRLLMGEMGQRLASDAFMRQLPMPPCPIRIYAGIGAPRAAWLPLGMAPNDGILALSEATGSHAALALEVPALHTFIMNSQLVVQDMLDMLEDLERHAIQRIDP